MPTPDQPPAGPPGVEVPSAPSGDLAVLLAEARREIERHVEARRLVADALRELVLSPALAVRFDGFKLAVLNDDLRRVRLLLQDLRGDLVPTSASPAHPPESP